MHPFSPTSNSGDIVVSVISQDNKASRFHLSCKSWFIEIENSEPGKLIGW